MLILSFFTDLGVEANDFKNTIFDFFKNIYFSIENFFTKYMGENAFLVVLIFIIALIVIAVFNSIINKR